MTLPPLRQLGLFLAVSFLLIPACTGSPKPSEMDGSPTEPARRRGPFELAGATFRVDGDLRPCEPLSVARILLDFVSSIGHQPSRTLAFINSDFQWYSVTVGEGPDDHFVARDGDSFAAYLAERNRQRESLKLIAGMLRPGEGATVNFVIVLIRQADDLPSGVGGPEQVAEAKGKLGCGGAGSIVALSMAMNRPPDYAGYALDVGLTEAELRAKLAATLLQS